MAVHFPEMNLAGQERILGRLMGMRLRWGSLHPQGTRESTACLNTLPVIYVVFGYGKNCAGRTQMEILIWLLPLNPFCKEII